jgi:hypothetical protein
MLSRTVSVCLLLPLLLAKLHAGPLTWTNDKISTGILEGQPADVKATFLFKNTSGHSVAVKSVETSCGCTTVGLKKKTYAAGESGEIDAVFHPGGRTGLQEKYITVTTDDPGLQPDRLLFSIDIKPFLTIAPRLLKWKMGEKAAEQMVVLSGLPSQPIREIKAQAEKAGIVETRIETVKKGEVYNVYIKPVSTAVWVSTTIDFQTRFAGIADRTVKAYVFVNPPGVDQHDDGD